MSHRVLRRILRPLHNWLRPAGLFIVVLGPDGVGKSTAVQHLRDRFGCLFDGCRVFHCRPFVLKRINDLPQLMGRPHDRQVRGVWMSALFLFGLFVDCWLGYLLTTGPLVARSGLVIFDRYFHDVLIDPKRYRYGGPQWLTKLLCLLAPPAKPLFLVLDANEEVIFGRKQELPIDELKRQRKAYLEFAARYSSAVVVDCNDAKRASANVFCAVRVYVSRRSRTIPLTTRYDSTH